MYEMQPLKLAGKPSNTVTKQEASRNSGSKWNF